MYNPVGWFELPVLDMPRAIAFYQAVFGYSMQARPFGAKHQMAFFPMDMEHKGVGGALFYGEGCVPSAHGTLVYFTAPDIDATAERVVAAGGKIVLPKTDIGEYGWMAWAIDTEGNRIGLHTQK